MTTADDFYRAIRESPADDHLRLVFADWIDDHDAGALTPWHRATSEYIRMTCGYPRISEVEEQAWLKANWFRIFTDWGARHRPDFSEIETGCVRLLLTPNDVSFKFSRGFVEQATISVHSIVAQVPRLVHHCPVAQMVAPVAYAWPRDRFAIHEFAPRHVWQSIDARIESRGLEDFKVIDGGTQSENYQRAVALLSAALRAYGETVNDSRTLQEARR